MTPPTKLIFREWKKPEVTYELHGWRPDKASAYGVDDKGQPKVLEFVLPAEFNEHARPTPVFTQHPPSEVTEIRLVPPPCFADQAEAHAWRAPARANEEVLFLRPEDEVPLAELLKKFKEEKAREYAARKQELHMLLELIRSRQPICGRARYYAHIVSNGCEPPSSDSASVWHYFLNQERIKLDMDFGQGGYKKGFLRWTPEDARTRSHIRDPYLQSKWAKENGFDLEKMAEQRKQIAAWSGIVDSGDPVKKFFKDVLGKDFDRHQFPTAPSPATLEMAKANDLEFGASIRFCVTFTDKRQAWLTGCPIRNPEPEERPEFGVAQEKIVTLETIKGGLDSVEKKTDRVLSGVKTLTARAKERKTTDDSTSLQDDFTKLKLPSGKIVHPPESAREILRALVAGGSRNVSCQAIKREVAKIRGLKLSDNYSPAKVLKGSTVGRAILDQGVVSYERKPRQKQAIYTLRLR